jgi:hypothetical protein
MNTRSLLASVFFCSGIAALAQQSATWNGNDLALSYSEARNARDRAAVLASAARRPHYFRYLQIMEMEEVNKDGRTEVRIVAQEPASGMDIAFVINQRVSLKTLGEDPVSQRGRAIAISGIVSHVDDKTGTMHMRQAIVRHKDRLSPSLLGREMLYEIDDRNIFYSFSGGRETVQLAYRDRDLLQHRRILDEQGDQAWADFLAREIAAREKQRREGAKQNVPQE